MLKFVFANLNKNSGFMAKPSRILLVEDDSSFAKLLLAYLSNQGYDVVWAPNADSGYDKFITEEFDLLLIDVVMPGKDGYSLAEQIRQVNKQIPLVFLTARSLKDDYLKGFDVGADDYITKPFTMEVLSAKMAAILRRSGAVMANEEVAEVSIGEYLYNYQHSELKHSEETRKLTSKENELLHLLVKNKNALLERKTALNHIWGESNYYNGRSMDVYIAKLRKYLSSDESIDLLNVHGKGFRLAVS